MKVFHEVFLLRSGAGSMPWREESDVAIHHVDGLAISSRCVRSRFIELAQVGHALTIHGALPKQVPGSPVEGLRVQLAIVVGSQEDGVIGQDRRRLPGTHWRLPNRIQLRVEQYGISLAFSDPSPVGSAESRPRLCCCRAQ